MSVGARWFLLTLVCVEKYLQFLIYPFLSSFESRHLIWPFFRMSILLIFLVLVGLFCDFVFLYLRSQLCQNVVGLLFILYAHERYFWLLLLNFAFLRWFLLAGHSRLIINKFRQRIIQHFPIQLLQYSLRVCFELYLEHIYSSLDLFGSWLWIELEYFSDGKILILVYFLECSVLLRNVFGFVGVSWKRLFFWDGHDWHWRW